jgi:hypothetical protein
MTKKTFSAYYTKSNFGEKNSTEWCKQIFGILLKSCFRQYVCSPTFCYLMLMLKSFALVKTDRYFKNVFIGWPDIEKYLAV